MGKCLFFFAFLPVLISFWGYIKNQERWTIWLLMLSAFLLRLAVSMMDPFLHDWDERFHALVAKNMMSHPFKPMLRVDVVLPYDYTAWCCNHIWVHKQPLFMWQMALSMKIFGVNEIAVRLPSALLSAATVWCVYRIALIWTNTFSIAYVAALLHAFAYYQIEMVSGKECLDHNDLVFTTYVTGSIWAFCEYTRKKSIRWALAAGCFVGCAILVKWLTGLLVFGGWGLWIILDKEERVMRKNYRDILLAFALSMAIAMPWQCYISWAFPRESAWEYAYNYQHITEKLGEFAWAGWTFHFMEWPMHYGNLLLPFFAMGLLALMPAGKSKLTIPLLAMVIVVFSFFSFIVQTKMPAFTYIVSPIVLIIIATGIYQILWFIAKISLHKKWLELPLLLLVALNTFRPWAILEERSPTNKERNIKIANTGIFKTLDQKVPPGYLVFNCKSFEDVDLLFYNRYNAHSWCPSEAHLDSLLEVGHKIAVFQAHKGKKLPDYVLANPNVLIIKQELE